MCPHEKWSHNDYTNIRLDNTMKILKQSSMLAFNLWVENLHLRTVTVAVTPNSSLRHVQCGSINNQLASGFPELHSTSDKITNIVMDHVHCKIRILRKWVKKFS